MKLPPSRGRGPLGMAAFIAIPLFFSSLMSASLAVEKPRVAAWRDGSVLHLHYHDPSATNELSIWLWALLPPLLLVIAGWVATRVPQGFYVAARVCKLVQEDVKIVDERILLTQKRYPGFEGFLNSLLGVKTEHLVGKHARIGHVLYRFQVSSGRTEELRGEVKFFHRVLAPA